jgi:hypothetical protein
MSRVVGRLAFAFLLALAGLAPAGAADMSGRAPTAAVDERSDVGAVCRGPRVEVARYKEQICQRGVSGYASCRWVDREHEVHVPAACEPRYTVETARPADRGAFPPYPRVAPRG